MNSNVIKFLFMLGTSLLSGANALAQLNGGAFAVTASVIAGGGGTSTGGVFAVSGTLGQPAAGGPLTNRAFSLTSGFWPKIVVVPMPGAPKLDIRVVQDAQGGAIVVSWPTLAPGAPTFRLQSAERVGDPGSWTDSPGEVVVIDHQNTVAFRPIFNPPYPVQFFRLMRAEP